MLFRRLEGHSRKTAQILKFKNSTKIHKINQFNSVRVFPIVNMIQT